MPSVSSDAPASKLTVSGASPVSGVAVKLAVGNSLGGAPPVGSYTTCSNGAPDELPL